MPAAPKMGTIGWLDLTVPDAEGVRDFSREVAGWVPSPAPMGGYDGYRMTASGTGEPAAGICHARGVNAGLPPVWLVYVAVVDLDASMERCRELGGGVVTGPPGRCGWWARTRSWRSARLFR